ncbi:hypothetical protein [Clostridium peptidivorans]|uniref:hypothetical protein n=1 Tax=Clostridium peptidivorans TaxID=100174 RepID=UPI000BE36008|nr:hypothetical protein [Clostridium peptidivorans]
MKCHGDNGENKGNHKHSMLKHMLHMILCCGLPIVIIGLLPLITKFSPGAAGLLAIISPFICPLMMVGMMVMMMRGNKKGSCCDNKSANNDKLNKFIQ